MAKVTRTTTITTGMTELAARLNKKFGIGTALYGKQLMDLKVEFYSTGIAALDIALRGGLPYNRIVEIIGEEQTCKTTMMALCSRNFQTQNPNGLTVYVDLENTLDPQWFQKMGVDMRSNFLVVRADSGEQAGDIVQEALAARTVEIQLILDSIMGVVPENELESTTGSHFVGAMPSLINRIIRVANSRLKSSVVGANARTSVILVNQTRPKIGSFIPGLGSSGGEGRKFFASQRVMFTNGSQADSREDRKEGDFKVSSRFARKVNFSIIKNKTGGAEESGHFMFYHRASGDIPFGIDNAGSLINYGLLYGVLRREANTVFFGKMKLGGSVDKAAIPLRLNDNLSYDLYMQIMEATETVEPEEEAPAPVRRVLRISRKPK